MSPADREAWNDRNNGAPDIVLLWQKRPVARKAHLCMCCHEGINPGERYTSVGMLNDGVFEHLKTHVDAYYSPSGCPKLATRDQADLEAELLEFGFPMAAQP